MIRKISGKNISPNYTHLNLEGTNSKATSKTDIADTLGETFCHNSSSFNYSESFPKIKTEQEKVKLNFKSQNNNIYNKDFHKTNSSSPFLLFYLINFLTFSILIMFS